MSKEYRELTKEKIEEYLKDLMYTPDPKNNIVIYCWGYEDENGNIRCGFLEEFDKAMKAEAKKLWKDQE